MDFFDPQKQKEHALRLTVGYALIAIVLVLATTILLYRARGYDLDENGQVIQNGLVFVASAPDGATVYVNGKKYKDKTNTRLDIPAGQYTLEIKKNGYRSWKRDLSVVGEKVGRFHYPFLLPTSPLTTVAKQYATPLGLTTQSPDRRWLMVSAADQNTFDLFDLRAAKPTSRTLAVASDVLAAGSATKAWKVVDWSKDNRHVLLLRSYDKLGQAGSEYILFDREDPTLTQNLSVLLGFSPSAIELRGGAYDNYYAFDQTNSQLFTASLKRPTPQPYISDVLAFTSEDSTVMYATSQGAIPGKTRILLQENDNPPYVLRQVSQGTNYLLDMAHYGNKLYAVLGAQSENRVYVFRDPLAALKKAPSDAVIPTQLLKIASPTHVSFSAVKRFVLAENADHFATYDAETKRSYTYQTKVPLDAPQTYATWMDDFRLAYVGGGKLIIMDYDGTNAQAVTSASPSHLPFFDINYHFLYTIDGQNALTSTALKTPGDL